MASLEHEHIVQVFSESVDGDRNARLLCMQYVPGTDLGKIIRALAESGTGAVSGRTLVDMIDEVVAKRKNVTGEIDYHLQDAEGGEVRTLEVDNDRWVSLGYVIARNPG